MEIVKFSTFWSAAISGEWPNWNQSSVIYVQVLTTVQFWHSPIFSHIKVNFEAAIFKLQNKVDLGVVAQNSSCECITWRVKMFDDPLIAKFIEAKAAVLVCEACREFFMSKCFRRRRL
ncbi:hypothetical protein CDL12_10103 [Handroanthus impetiginosus]|uniref:Uncharacterized protein n=1 Tax=Handroanthus impetiginosus TaxID=429701 RepID=A0A2G9HI97_9LAMI|nr:hypothetical protein CDL12_10103 [Handroanthus impetiginosus]